MLEYEDIGRGRFYHGDCFEAMREIPDGVIDMVMCDLPYGTTQNKWDSVLPLDELWKEYWRISIGRVVLTAAQPFTSALVSSNYKDYKHNWAWIKNNATGHLNAKKMPMRIFEDVLVFCEGLYNPQGVIDYGKITKSGTGSKNFGKYGKEWLQEKTGYPRNILEFSYDSDKIHPTQKPAALFEYLIKTYTNEGDLVLDNCAGSGTAAIACENTGRRWVCIEKDDEYYAKAVERVRAHVEAKGLSA